MKPIYSLLAVAAALTVGLTACGGHHLNNATQPVTAGFSCQAAIQYHEMTLQAQLTRQTDGKLTLAFTQPKSLSGVALGWDGHSMTMELGGMSVAIPSEKVPQGALIQRLLQVLTADHGGGTVTEDGYVLTGEIEGEAYTLVFDPATGLPVALSLPAEELEAAFTQGMALGATA